MRMRSGVQHIHRECDHQRQSQEKENEEEEEELVC